MSSRAEAYAQVREVILRGQLQPEAPTSERMLAERHDMSRMPVREALAVLAAVGLVDQIPQRGVEVHPIDSHEALQAIRLRMAIESVTVEELARSGGADSDELRDAVASMESAYGSGDQIEFMLADTRLHVEIARLGGFNTSLTALQGLRDRVHLFRLQQPLGYAEMRAVLDEHHALIQAIAAHDVSRAREAIEAHLVATRLRIEGTGSVTTASEPELADTRG